MTREEQWDQRDRWSVTETYLPISWGVQNMTHDEIVESVLDDLLIVHYDGLTEGVHWTFFFRWIVSDNQRNRVLEALLDCRVQALIIDDNQMIRLRSDRLSLQEAMDIAGAWYEGFDPPAGTNVLQASPKLKEMVNGMGIEGTVEYLAALFVHPDAEKSIH